MLPGNYVKHIWLLVPSGQAFAAQSQLQSQLGMAVCIPSTKLRNAEAWMLPTMWAGYSKPAQQQGKTFLAIFSIVYKVNFCLQDRQLSAFYNAHSWYLQCSVGQTVGVRAQSRVFGTEDLMPRSYQECLRGFYFGLTLWIGQPWAAAEKCWNTSLL